MMPILARNPPSPQDVATTIPAVPALLLLKNSIVDENFASFEVKQQRSWRSLSWRRRNSALLLLWTVLVLFTVNFTVADHAGLESVSEVESESGNNSKFARPHECMRKRTTTTPGLTTTRMNIQQLAVPNLKDWPLQGMQGFQRRHRKGRYFIFPDRRRVLVASACTNKDISIFQKTDGSSGIPRYAVQIMNNCMSECAPSNIHVFCGWFASAMLVNPNSFKRLAFDDCVVNGGRPLRHGETLRFTYANSFMYPIRFKSASFCK